MSIFAHISIREEETMREEQWIVMGLTACLLLTLLGISLSSEPHSGWYRWTRRVFWSAALLLLSGALGGVGLNQWNLATAVLLGLPGYAALTVIAAM